MGMPDILSIMGDTSDDDKDDRMAMGILLRFLADMLTSKRDDLHQQRASEQTNEIAVRPRIEPLGGS